MQHEDFYPTTVYDYLLLGVTAAAAVPFIAANGVLFWHRKRPYFQAQGGVYLILGNSIAGLVFLVSLFVTNGHFSKGGPLHSCVLWIFWLQSPGICMWFIFMVLRLRRMYEISHGIENSRWRYIFVALCLSPCVVFASVSYSSDFDREKHGHYYCVLGMKWQISIWVVANLYWMLIIAAMYSMRNQQDPLLAKEYTHSFDYVTMALVVNFLSGVAQLIGASESVLGRCFLTFSVVCVIYSYFWIRFGWPVYLFLFRPREEMDMFERELTRPEARALDASYSSEAAIWEAFIDARERLGTYTDEIQKLQARKKQLEGWIRELQLQKNNMATTSNQL